VRPQRAHAALKEPTALLQRPQRAEQTPISGVVIVHVLNVRSPPHGVLDDCTAHKQRCWRLHIAHLGDLQLFWTLWERCVYAPLCNRSLNGDVHNVGFI